MSSRHPSEEQLDARNRDALREAGGEFALHHSNFAGIEKVLAAQGIERVDGILADGTRTPAGRWGKVEELIGAALFLSADSASFVNGHILYVDGGITASL